MKQMNVTKVPVQVAIIDCEKAGLIGGPYAVYVLEDKGQVVGSYSSIKTLERAQDIAAEMRRVYGKKKGYEVAA